MKGSPGDYLVLRVGDRWKGAQLGTDTIHRVGHKSCSKLKWCLLRTKPTPYT
jgi:hypothetical protein